VRNHFVERAKVAGYRAQGVLSPTKLNKSFSLRECAKRAAAGHTPGAAAGHTPGADENTPSNQRVPATPTAAKAPPRRETEHAADTPDLARHPAACGATPQATPPPKASELHMTMAAAVHPLVDGRVVERASAAQEVS
jgi:hypothetical protein